MTVAPKPAARTGAPVESLTERCARALYTLAWYLASPIALAYLFWRSRRQPDYLRRIGERLGRHPTRADAARLIWVHAVSVGETRAAQPLVRALLERYPEHRLLLTHMTPTGLDTGRELFGQWMGSGPSAAAASGVAPRRSGRSAAAASGMAPRHRGRSAGAASGDAPRVAQALLPWDYPFAIRRFLHAWRPSIGLIMETELWPNVTAVCEREGVPLALVNARLSARSLNKGQRWKWLIRPALQRLALVLAQTEPDARRIRALGREAVPVLGNLKFDVTPPERLESLGHEWRRALLACAGGPNHRAAIVAASTRDGEEALLLDAWCEAGAGRAGPDASQAPTGTTPWPPLLVIVPRHPQRFDEVAQLVAARGLQLARRSSWTEGEPLASAREADVLLGDSMGEMFAYYALADVAVIGGSLLPFGGQNLIEACAVGVPVVVGPHMFNFEAATEEAIAEDAAVRVPDVQAALQQALRIIADPVGGRSMGERAMAFAARHRGATARTLAALEPLLAGADERGYRAVVRS